MLANVRYGYAFYRIVKYMNTDGSLRKEKIYETISGPAEIIVTPEEVVGQEHKLERLRDDPSPDDILESPDSDPSGANDTSAQELPALQSSTCLECGSEFDRAKQYERYCSQKCRTSSEIAVVKRKKTTRKDTPSIIEFVSDPQLLGLSLSPAQEACLRAIYGLPLAGELAELYALCTGREAMPSGSFSEVTVIAGARAGKDSRIAAPVAIYESLFGGHEIQLAPGEHAVIPLVAQDQRATRVAFNYIRAYLERSALLANEIQDFRATEIRLKNNFSIHCFPSTLRSLRGYSIPAGILDELAFFRMEGSADSDTEIQASIRRGMLSFPNPRLVKISTPYMRSGVLWDDFRAAFGQDNPDRLVWRAPSILMNPSVGADRLERERRLDPSRFAREYEAEFADDLEAFLPSTWVDEAVVKDRHELPPTNKVHYLAAVDVSGGGPDAFTFAVVHTEGVGEASRVVQDVMKGWQRARDLESVVREIADIVRRYRLGEVQGDKYGAGWVRQTFQRAGIFYRDSPLDKSRAYLEAEPLFAQGRIELLDHPQLLRELKLLERRPRQGGRDRVDHPHGSHDDYANALCLAAALALTQAQTSPRFWRVGAKREHWVRIN